MRRPFALALLTAAALFGEENQEVAVVLTRSDAIPPDATVNATDQYFEGYVQALVDMNYYEYQVVVIVKNHKVYLANLPKNQLIATSIVNFVKDVPGVKDVQVVDQISEKEKEIHDKYVSRPQYSGIWFPQQTELFQPLVADPRNVTYTAGWRSGDRVMGNKAISIALGDDFPIYRWLDITPWHGDLQISIEAGIWSVFNMDPHPNPIGGVELVNTDFYGGIPLTYAAGKWSWRLRAYHISSHLGDEYIENNPTVKRVNPSMEIIDLAAAWQVTEAIRLYAMPGAIVHSDHTYRLSVMFIQYGAEARFAGTKFPSARLYGTFFLAIHIRNMQFLHWNFDGTYRGGYELSKMSGVGRKLRLWVGYHQGYSLEGQFMRERTHYLEFNFNYGF